MVRQDIVAAIKNSVERGYSLDQAAQVMVNSGYSMNDVSEAVNYLSGGVNPQFNSLMSQQKRQLPIPQQINQSSQYQPQQIPQQMPQKYPQKPLYSQSIPQPPKFNPAIKPVQPQYIPPQPIYPGNYNAQPTTQYPVNAQYQTPQYQTPQEAVFQNISRTEEKIEQSETPAKKEFPIAIVSLSVILVLLIILLILTFVFKDNIISWLNKF